MTVEQIETLTENDFLGDVIYDDILKVKNPLDRTKTIAKYRARARKLKIASDFDKLLKAHQISFAKAHAGGTKRTKFTTSPVNLACGDWDADDKGVRRNAMRKDGDTITVEWASTIPILPTCLYQNIETGVEKIKLEFYKNSAWRSIIIERSRCASTTKIVDLADQGIEVTSENARLLVAYISDVVAYNQGTLPVYKSVSHLGWSDGKFLPYDADITFDGEREYRTLLQSVSQCGSLEEWVEYTHDLRRNLLLRLQMAASFASPLIELIGALPFVLHLWGGTGSGKTVGLMTAMSIWGNPRMGGMTRTMNMTDNAMMTSAAMLRNLPFGGDELQTVKNTFGSYDKLIMRVTEGIDRGRMTYDKVNETKTWCCAFLFTGEEPCTSDTSGGGAVNRVIDLECSGKVVENGNAVVNFISKHYGVAGEKYIAAVKAIADLQKQYSEIFQAIITRGATTEKQAMALACMLLADKIAVEIFYRQETPLTIDDVAQYLASPDRVDAAERAFEYAMGVIASNENRFTAESTGEIWGKITDHGQVITINKTKLCEILKTGGFDFNAVKRSWSENGHLRKNSQGKYHNFASCYGVKALYVVLLQQ